MMTKPHFKEPYEPEYRRMYRMLHASCDRSILLLEETMRRCEELYAYGNICDEKCHFDDLDYLDLMEKNEMMSDYEKLYHIMFNAVTDALRYLEKGEKTNAMVLLAAAQCRCEALYIEATTELA